jgi:hypothetical protein
MSGQPDSDREADACHLIDRSICCWLLGYLSAVLTHVLITASLPSGRAREPSKVTWPLASGIRADAA